MFKINSSIYRCRNRSLKKQYIPEFFHLHQGCPNLGPGPRCGLWWTSMWQAPSLWPLGKSRSCWVEASADCHKKALHQHVVMLAFPHYCPIVLLLGGGGKIVEEVGRCNRWDRPLQYECLPLGKKTIVSLPREALCNCHSTVRHHHFGTAASLGVWNECD